MEETRGKASSRFLLATIECNQQQQQYTRAVARAIFANEIAHEESMMQVTTYTTYDCD